MAGAKESKSWHQPLCTNTATGTFRMRGKVQMASCAFTKEPNCRRSAPWEGVGGVCGGGGWSVPPGGWVLPGGGGYDVCKKVALDATSDLEDGGAEQREVDPKI